MANRDYSRGEFGCLSCRSGSEFRAQEFLRSTHPELETLVPSRMRIRRAGGEATEEQATIFPGYVFFHAERAEDISYAELVWYHDIYRLLTNMDGEWALRGPDRAMIEKIYATGGVVGFSKAYFVGERIRILDGFLKEYEGDIIRVNKRARTAQIRVSLNGKMITAWLGYELIDK